MSSVRYFFALFYLFFSFIPQHQIARLPQLCPGATSSLNARNKLPQSYCIQQIVHILEIRQYSFVYPSVTSVANDKGDNEMILGAVLRSPGIYLAAEENPGKPQLGDRR